jgi:Arm DNA-binding domain
MVEGCFFGLHLQAANYGAGNIGMGVWKSSCPFGKYPDVTLTVAREKHGEARKLLAAGLDPMVQRKTEKMAERVASENSFESVARIGEALLQ